MKIKSLILALAIAVATTATAQVKTGIEVLRDNGFAQLKGKKVGLITNPTGVDSHLKSTIDILNEAEGVELKALYSPEHGVRGDITAGAKVEDYVDATTGVQVYSIYGRTTKPTPEMLKGLDALVYDIQDIGSRSYTFISTMGKAMEAAAENNIEMVILDRPNPLGGVRMEGCLVTDGFYSFVSQFPIPYVHGLTSGELAQFLNENYLEKPCKLTVVKMKGWKRNMSFGIQVCPGYSRRPTFRRLRAVCSTPLRVSQVSSTRSTSVLVTRCPSSCWLQSGSTSPRCWLRT